MSEQPEPVTSCASCGWPVPDDDCHICVCCGYEPICDDGGNYTWDGRWWAKSVTPPQIVQRLEAQLAALTVERDTLQGEKERLEKERRDVALDNLDNVEVAMAHWFTQGGTARFGPLLFDGREPENSDEFISALLDKFKPYETLRSSLGLCPASASAGVFLGHS